LLYKEILSQAHEHEFGPNRFENRVIWQIAEDREANKQADPTEDQEHIKWLRCVKDNPTVAVTLKNLGLLYRKQGKYEAASVLEDLALRAKKEVSFL
jgi:kinesin light chain